MVGETPEVEEPVVQATSEVNWDEHQPVAGLEHLGRAIVDENGQPSGSPANFEKTRGITGNPDLPNVADVVAAINAEFGQP